MVGSAMAHDLAKQHQVTVADRDHHTLSKLEAVDNITTRQADLSDPQQIQQVLEGADFAVGAVPGFMGYKTLKTIIEYGTDVVDISFFPEDAFGLDELAKERNVTAIVDCGVAPGMSNLLLGHHSTSMHIENFECYVGGLPANPKAPFNYKAPFSPADVIEEYVRTARLVENSKTVERPALSEVVTMNFAEVGILESFNSDGLRSLIKTMDIPNMKEKTLRYPGHAELMRVFRETGLFSEEPVALKSQQVIPLELTSRLLFEHWKLKEDEHEFTVMKILIEGTAHGQKKSIQYNLLDRFDEATQTSSMARTTGYTCTAAIDLLVKGKFKRKGICPPEYVGMEEGCTEAILSYLQERGIEYKHMIS